MFAAQHCCLLGSLSQVNNPEAFRTAIVSNSSMLVLPDWADAFALVYLACCTVVDAPAEARDHQQVPQAGQQTETRLLRMPGRLTQQHHQMSLPASSQPRFHSEVYQHPIAYSSLHLSSVYRGTVLEGLLRVMKQHQITLAQRSR